MPKFTKKMIEDLPLPASGQKLIWDDSLPGFGLRLNSKSRVYIAQTRVNGKSLRVSIGKHGVFTLDQARIEAKKLLLEMAQGTDPIIEKKRQKALSVTLEEAFASYLNNRKRKLKPRSVKDIQGHLEKIFADWKKMPIPQISRSMVQKKFQQASEKSPAQANQAFSILRAILNYSIETFRPDDVPVLPENPVNVLSGQKAWNKIEPKNRRVPLEKVGVVYNYLNQIRMLYKYSHPSSMVASAIIFILFTGCRRDEALTLKWDAIDFKRSTWRIAAPKNNRPITLPLCSQTQKLLESLPRVNEFVFSSTAPKGHVLEPKRLMKKVSEIADTYVTAHDLRRTFLSIAAENHIEYVRCKLLLNHTVRGDITLEHYAETDNLSWLAPEAQKIGDWIERQGMIAASSNVIDIALARK